MNNVKKTESAVYTVDEIAEKLRIGRNSAYALANDNLFPVIRIGKKIRIPKEKFNEWLNRAC